MVRYRTVYDQLREVKNALAGPWRPLATALRRFNSTYERTVSKSEDRVLDAITAVESLVGDKSETTFKVSMRVACLLEGSDDARVEVYRSMKANYDTRSVLVHGGDLKPKHAAIVEDPQPLLEVVRRLLGGFLSLAASGEYARAIDIKETLDEVLLHTEKTRKLRARMGL
jgi:hypothetical protein